MELIEHEALFFHCIKIKHEWFVSNKLLHERPPPPLSPIPSYFPLAIFKTSNKKVIIIINLKFKKKKKKNPRSNHF